MIPTLKDQDKVSTQKGDITVLKHEDTTSERKRALLSNPMTNASVRKRLQIFERSETDLCDATVED